MIGTSEEGPEVDLEEAETAIMFMVARAPGDALTLWRELRSRRSMEPVAIRIRRAVRSAQRFRRETHSKWAMEEGMDLVAFRRHYGLVQGARQ